MNSSFPEVKKQINVNAEEEILVLTDFAVEFKKIRPVGQKNRYFLIELPRIFLNGHFDEKKKYCIKLAYGKNDNHRLIVIDLDNSAPILSLNNRRKIVVVNSKNNTGGVTNGE